MMIMEVKKIADKNVIFSRKNSKEELRNYVFRAENENLNQLENILGKFSHIYKL